MTKLRRNDIVMEAQVDMYRFYGRVWKRYDDDHVIVIDCGKYVRIFRDDQLERVTNYKGRYSWQRHPGNEYDRSVVWRPMSSLRKLKRMATQYQPYFGGSKWYTKAERLDHSTIKRYEPRD